MRTPNVPVLPAPSRKRRAPTVIRCAGCPRRTMKRNMLSPPRHADFPLHFTRIAATPFREIRTRRLRIVTPEETFVVGGPRSGGVGPGGWGCGCGCGWGDSADGHAAPPNAGV